MATLTATETADRPAGPPASERNSPPTAVGSTSGRVLLILLLAAVGAWTVFRFSWISDDALITARVVANTVNGAGPVFNLDERVQAFTHPLWFMIWTVAANITGEIILVPIILGMVASTATLLLVGLSSLRLWAGVVAVIALILSPTFATWSTSGLENSLGALLLGSAWVVSRRQAPTALMVASGLVGLAALTRLDLAVIGAPVVLWMIWESKTWKPRLAVAALAVGPGLAYMAWSYAFYGYALPATYYAKTNAEIPRIEFVEQGLRYLLFWIEQDPLSALLLAVAMLWLAWRPTWRRSAWLVGITAYIGYVVYIGGDFMAGRFFYVPFVLAAFTIAEPPTPVLAADRRSVPWAVALAVLLAGAQAPTAVALAEDSGQQWRYGEHAGIADERGVYMEKGHGVFGYAMRRSDGGRIAELRGSANRWSTAPETGNREVRKVATMCGQMGNRGLLLGPSVYILDTCGLADIYLAQIPFTPSQDGTWRIGHFYRDVPLGYTDAVIRGENVVVDPGLADLLDQTWARTRP